MEELNDLISIITPFRDGADFLPRFVANLKEQTYVNWECLLVDHFSIDGSNVLVKELTKGDSRFRCLAIPRSMENEVRRPAIPRNYALDHILGELICFLDVDDLWHPQKLEHQLAFHRRNGLDVSVTAYGLTSTMHHGRLIWRCPPPSLSLKRLMQSNAIPMLTVMMDARLFRKSSETLPLRFLAVRHEDYVMWLRLWRLKPQLHYGCLAELLALHQRHGQNLTGKRTLMLLWLYQVYRNDNQAPVLAALLALSCAVRQLFRSFGEKIGLRNLHFTPKQALEPGFVLSQQANGKYPAKAIQAAHNSRI